jgi:hypothetical protein
MNVPTIGQGPGGVGAFAGPRVDTTQSDAPRPSTDAGFNWVGWFDLHGTGRIVNRSPASGGDGVMIVPSVVHVPTYTRAVHHSNATASHTSERQGNEQKAPPTDVQTRQALDAYARYGTADATDAPTERAVA